MNIAPPKRILGPGLWFACFNCVIYCFGSISTLSALQTPSETLFQPATWQTPTVESTQQLFQEWLTETNASASISKQTRQFIAEQFPIDHRERLDFVVRALQIARPELGAVVDQLNQQRTDNVPPDFSFWIDNPNQPVFVRDHVRLLLGRWLAQNKFYDEALEQLQSIDVNKIADPATLLYYRGLMQHQLLKQEACVATVQQLLQQEGQLPQRYTVLAKLMLADIQPLQPDSLDEIARLMSDIERRTGLHRAGQIVRDQEQQVIDKLDKLISSLEAQQMQTAPSSGGSSSPMEDSRRASGKGDGEVKRKHQIDGGEWGNLPPAERAAALAEMAKDMPPHYREVIEEYFRQLANEDDQ